MDVGTVIAGRYEIRSPIRTGGMGQVWLAQDGHLGRTVAVKTMRPDLGGDQDRVQRDVRRFQQEAMAVARLDHIGLAAVHDLGEEDGTHYLIMQYVQGLDLGDLIAEHGRLGTPEAASVTVQICSVLAAAHAQHIVHRDLKPGNVRVRTDGLVKVLDFGAAALLDSNDTRLTNPGSAAPGTWLYMAPEQIAGEEVSNRTDLYALGCLLYEMVSGRPPFTSSAPLMVPNMHRTEVPLLLGVLEPSTPKDVEALVAQLLAKDPDDRPAHAGVVYQIMAGHLPEPRPPQDALRPWIEADPCRPFAHPMSPGARAVREWAAGTP